MIDWEAVTGENDMDKQTSIFVRMSESLSGRSLSTGRAIWSRVLSVLEAIGLRTTAPSLSMVGEPDMLIKPLNLGKHETQGMPVNVADYPAGTQFIYRHGLCFVRESADHFSRIEECE